MVDKITTKCVPVSKYIQISADKCDKVPGIDESG